MKNRPPYALDSVDNALQLIQLLRDQGRLRVTDAARELGVGRSTAHRLLAMLVYRGFAEQDDARGYVPGPSLVLAAPMGDGLRELRAATLPAMERLCERAEETVNLMVRVDTRVRFVATVESRQILHVGDRRGTILPAAKTSGGKAMLATVPSGALASMYGIGTAEQSLSAAEWQKLTDELAVIRRRGYAINAEETEAGVYAIGMALSEGHGVCVSALSIAMPTARQSRRRTSTLARELKATVEGLQRRDGYGGTLRLEEPEF